MKIRTKLGLGFGIQVALASILGISVLFGMLSVKRHFSFVVEHDAPVIANARHLSKLVVDMETGQRGFCITHQEEFLEPYTTGTKEFAALIEEEKNLVSDNPSQVAALQRIEHLVRQWKQKAAEPEIAARREMNEHPDSLKDVAALLEAGTGKALLDEIRSEFDEFLEIETRRAAEHYGIASKTTAWTRNLAAGLLVFAICVGVVVAVLISHTIAHPLVELARGAEAVGSGDLDTQIKVRSSDEIGALARAFNAMASNLKEAAFMRRQAERKLTTAHGELQEQVVQLEQAQKIALSMMEDIERESAERKRAEERLRHEKELSDDVINSLPGLFYVFDEERLVRWNKRWETVIGYPEKELEKMYGPDFFEGTDRVHITDRMQAVFREGTADAEAEIVTKDGRKIPFYFTGERSVFDGKPHLVGLGIDVTKQKQTEVELARARDEAEAANRAKSEFLANMSHEIRTPMTAILGYTDMLLDDLEQPEAIEAAQTVKRNGEHLLGIINDILDISKIESGKFEFEQLSCPPREIVAEVISLLHVRAGPKGLTLTNEYVGPLPETITTDPTRLRQILVNVVGNAIKFTETGNVRIVTRLMHDAGHEPKLRFDVIDTGIGISAKDLGGLFQPFMQADPSTSRRFGGTGLGLAISRRLARSLGGDITVKSEPGIGSTFTLTVATGPLEGVRLVEDLTEAAPADEQPAESSAEFQDKLQCRVLLAEDMPDNQGLIVSILRQAGADVTVAENGQETLKKALAAHPADPFDVIVMDMQMPVLDGYQATRRLRREGYTGPIIALTAYAMQGDRDKCLDAGCDDYISKPVDREELVSTLARYLSAPKDQFVSSES